MIKKCRWLIIFVFIAFHFVAYSPPGNCAQKPIGFSEVQKIDLFVTAGAVAKSERGFSTRSFRKGSIPGTFIIRPGINIYENPPVFPYVNGSVRINDGPQRNVRWRYRGLSESHWLRAFPERSMKINLDRSPDLGFDVLNLGIIETDWDMSDYIAMEIYQLYGLIAPEIKLVRFYINGKYAGFRILQENADEGFLTDRGLPIGNLYRENTFAVVGDEFNSGLKYYLRRWVKKSLNRQKDWSDWIHFNHVLALFNSGTSTALFDTNYFSRWMAMGFWFPFEHMIDHNIFLYHNFQDLKWYQIPWDPGAYFLEFPSEDIFTYAPNKLYSVFLRNPKNYYARNQAAWSMLSDDVFFIRMAAIVKKIYKEFETEYIFCHQQTSLCDQGGYAEIQWDNIRETTRLIVEKITNKRMYLKKLFSRLPEVSVVEDGDSLIVTGQSQVEFKIDHKGWKVESVENLIPINNSEQSSAFMVVPDPHAAHTYRGTRHIKVKDFRIVLTRLFKTAQPPRISSLFFSDSFLVLEQKTSVGDGLATKKNDTNIKKIGNDSHGGSHGLGEKLKSLWGSLNLEKLYRLSNNREDVYDILERLRLKLDYLKPRDHLSNLPQIVWSKEKVVNQTTIVPFGTELVIEPGTIVKLAPKVSLIVQGSLKIEGEPGREVLFTTRDQPGKKESAWGSVCFIHSTSVDSKIKHAIIEHGSQAFEMGVHCKGAVSAYHVPIVLEHAEFRFNHADDALNVLYSRAHVTDSYFHDNKSDALDADFSHVTVNHTRFINNGNDGLDLGTSIGESLSNFYLAQGDKGISVGEESNLVARGNVFFSNDKGIAVKDASLAKIGDNVFGKNKNAVMAYIKKSKYSAMTILFDRNYSYRNVKNFSQDHSVFFENSDQKWMELKTFDELPSEFGDHWIKERFREYVR